MFGVGLEVVCGVGVLHILQAITNIQVMVRASIASILRLEGTVLSRAMAACKLDWLQFIMKFEAGYFYLTKGWTQIDLKDFYQLLCTIFFQGFFFEWEAHH